MAFRLSNGTRQWRSQDFSFGGRGWLGSGDGAPGRGRFVNMLVDFRNFAIKITNFYA